MAGSVGVVLGSTLTGLWHNATRRIQRQCRCVLLRRLFTRSRNAGRVIPPTCHARSSTTHGHVSEFILANETEAS